MAKGGLARGAADWLIDGTGAAPGTRPCARSAQTTACRSRGSVRERGRLQGLVAACPACSSQSGHLIIEALLFAAPTREMDGEVGGYFDRLRQGPHDLAIYLLLLRAR